MSLSRSVREGLEVAGFALAEGIARASRSTEFATTLVVRRPDGMQCVRIEPHGGAMAHVARLLRMLGGSVTEAALLEEEEWAEQRTIAVSVWVQGEWRYQISLPYRPGTPLRIRPERIWDGLNRIDVGQALDAVYSGVSTHRDGLEAWAAAVIEL